MSTPIKTESSLVSGIVISIAIGVAAAYVTYAATAWIWVPFGFASAIIVGGSVARVILVNGYQRITIPVNYKGVAVRLGDKQTGKIYEAGDHWGIPGVSGAIPVDMRHQRIDLMEKFTATAANTSDVGVDGFVLLQIVDPVKRLAVKDLDESVRELLESRIRLFTSMVAKAENAVQFRDLLADYLELELTPDSKHERVRTRLETLKASSADCIVDGGIEALMEEGTAGEFKRILGNWGVKVEEVEIERFDVPEVIKEANLRKATQTVLMAAEKIRNTARAKMVAELVGKGVNANNAMNAVDLLLGLAVKKEVKEITITDLEKVAGQLSGAVVAALQQIFANRKNS